MSQPDLLTEIGFLVREFPTPANPHRPLALLTPSPDEDPGRIAEQVKDIAQNGYGGLILDPAGFGAGYPSEAWFTLVERYAEACRLLGLLLWLMDGFTAAAPLTQLLGDAIPHWRGYEIAVQQEQTPTADSPVLELSGPANARLLAVMAHAPSAQGQPLDLTAQVAGNLLPWTPPSGGWEVKSFWSNRARGDLAAAFNWTDPSVVKAWLALAYAPYAAKLGMHLGRTIQGFFTCCPTWPAQGDTWPLSLAADPTRLDLAELSWRFTPPEAGRPYLQRLAEAINAAYLAPIRNWCWHYRLRLAGYRLGGQPLPGTLAGFDFGGLPDLSAGASPDLVELAALAGISRYHRQEKVASVWSLTGEILADRTTAGRLVAAGADLFLVRRCTAQIPEGESALIDYAARISMGVSAGGPANEATLAMAETPEVLQQTGQQVLEMARAGMEAVCLPKDEALSLQEIDPLWQPGEAEAAPAAVTEPYFPRSLRVRARRVENWTVYTLFNAAEARWRGPVNLPTPGSTEIWYPSTGEQKPAVPVLVGDQVSVPLSLEAGETVLIVVRTPAQPQFAARSQLVKAHHRLSRNWRFIPAGGNVLPLAWREKAPGDWESSFMLLGGTKEIRLAGLPKTNLVWLNGKLVAVQDQQAQLGEGLTAGQNQLLIRMQSQAPVANLRGDFVCRGESIQDAPPEISGPWTLNGYPYFEGPGVYRQTFELPAQLQLENLRAWLEIEALADSVAIRLNGADLGFLPWPPYRLDLGPATIFKPGANLLELEIHAPASRPAWAFKGLLGEVSIYFREISERERDAWL